MCIIFHRIENKRLSSLPTIAMVTANSHTTVRLQSGQSPRSPFYVWSCLLPRKPPSNNVQTIILDAIFCSRSTSYSSPCCSLNWLYSKKLTFMKMFVILFTMNPILSVLGSVNEICQVFEVNNHVIHQYMFILQPPYHLGWPNHASLIHISIIHIFTSYTARI